MNLQKDHSVTLPRHTNQQSNAQWFTMELYSVRPRVTVHIAFSQTMVLSTLVCKVVLAGKDDVHTDMDCDMRGIANCQMLSAERTELMLVV